MTTTTNIHTNLIGWSNATYAVGARRGNAGNAYVCSAPGTSTAPPTGQGTNIAPGGTSRWDWLSAVDYTTLQAWADAIVATLTQPVVGSWWKDAAPAATYTIGSGLPFLWLHGHTTSSTNTITLQAAPGDSYKDTFVATPTTAYAYSSANGVAVEGPSTGVSSVNLFQIDDANVFVRGIQMRDPNSSSVMTLFAGSGNNCTLSQCILDGFTQAGGANMVQMSGTGFSMQNCLVVDRTTGLTTSTIKATGTGSVVVNSTIVCINNVSTMSALDAGTNASAGSSKAVNNIFVGYGNNIMVAQSGFIWSTNNNAYTNAAYGTNGVDNGGSLFNIVPSAVFVSPTTDFHLKPPSSVCLNAGATDTTDLPAANDAFGNSRPQGTFWDMGAAEVLAGGTIFRDLVVSVERKLSIFRGIGSRNPWSAEFSAEFGSGLPEEIPLEWSLGQHLPINDSPFNIEWRGSVSVDLQVRPEAKATPRIDRVVPLEFSLSTLNFARTVPVPLEWRNLVLRDDVASEESRLSIRTDAAAPVQWAASFVLSSVLSVEWRAATLASITSAVDSGAQFASDRSIFLEWSGFTGIVRDLPIFVDWTTPVSRSQITPAESTLQTQSSSVAPVDFQLTQLLDVPLTSGSGLSARVDSTLPVEASLLLAPAGRVAPVEWSLLAQASWTSPLEVGHLSSLDVPAPVESRASLTSDFVVSADLPASRVADVRISVDYQLIQGVGIGQQFLVDWRSVAVADSTGVVEILRSDAASLPVPLSADALARADALISTEAGALLGRSDASVVEWGHLSLTPAASIVVPSENVLVVVADFTGNIDLQFGRESIGASLEPDEWEFVHAP